MNHRVLREPKEVLMNARNQRKRWDSNWRLNGQDTEEIRKTGHCRTIRGLLADCQVAPGDKKTVTGRVLYATEKMNAGHRGQARTVRQSKQSKPKLETCSGLSMHKGRGLSAIGSRTVRNWAPD
jgi:hypothetical protein